jgi:ribosomal protein S28E/S33
MSFAQEFLLNLSQRLQREASATGKPKAKRAQKKASAFMLESLESRLLLSATPMEVLQNSAVAAPSAAIVTTDYQDYAPGETAVITTSNGTGAGPGFADGEMVRFQVDRTDGIADAPGTSMNGLPAGNEAWYVTDGQGGFTAYRAFDANGQAIDRDANGMADLVAPDHDLTVNGSIKTGWYVEQQYLGSSLQLTAAGLESGAVATTAFTDAAANTTTTMTPSATDTVYGTRIEFVVTVSDNSGAGAPTGTLQIVDGTTVLTSVTVPTRINPTSVEYRIRIADLTAGTHSIRARFIGTTDLYNNSESAAVTHTVAKLGVSGTFTVLNKIYDGSDAATILTRGVVGAVLGDDISFVGGTATFASANAAGGQVVTLVGATLAGADVDNYTLLTILPENGSISKADAIITGYNGVYDGQAHSVTAKGVMGEDLAGLTTLQGAVVNVGTYTMDWDYRDATGNYNNVFGTAAVTIAKANINVVGGYNVVYNGAAHTATAVAQGALGEELSGFVLNATARTNAGTYTDTWTYTDSTGNYNNATGIVTSTIAKADAAITVTGYNATYNATARQATGTAVGVLGEGLSGLNLSGTVHTNAGTYTDTWTFTDTTGNYNNATGTVINTIAKANAAITVTGYNVTYNAAAHRVAGTVTGVGGQVLSGLNLNATVHTNAGTYTDTWTFTDTTGNYNNATGSVISTIAKANAAITVTGYTGTYDAVAHRATGSALGVNGRVLTPLLNLNATVHTNAGTYTDTWTFTDTTGNYNNATGSVISTIAKANAAITVTGYTGTYDAVAHRATGSALGVNGRVLTPLLNLNATSHVNAGTYTDTWTFTDTTGNYNNATGTVTSTIAKADAAITVTGYNTTYNAAAQRATGSAFGVGGRILSGLNLTGTVHTNAGTYTDTWTFTDTTGNYNNATGSVISTIAKANAAITVTGYTGTYDAVAHRATGSALGVNGRVLTPLLNLNATSHVNAGTYTDTWTFTDTTGNYNNATGTVTSTIAKANATITVTGYSVTFDGVAHRATGSAIGVGGRILTPLLNLNATVHTNVGNYTDTWTFTDTTGNYNNATGTVIDVILPRV